jgi:dihydrofolate synthase/folylpolyglutamate synthase
MELPEALTWLDAHQNLERTGIPVAGDTRGLSLESMQALMGVLGDPQHACPVIHVTGTNGKGSVTRMAAALLAEAGLNVGTYTSPHLQSINERIGRNLEPIGDDELAEVLSELAMVAPLAGVAPSWFELTTAAAFSWFAQAPVDVAVVEVGLLGRWDATNVVDAEVAVVTNVERDHTDGEGDWRLRIAHEKAGIVKDDSFLVLGEVDAGVQAVFEDVSSPERRWVAGTDFGISHDVVAVGGRLCDLWTPHGTIDEVVVPLHGPHQSANAAMALAAVEALLGRGLAPELVQAALGGVTVPGRFEVVGHQPLVVLDGAHNGPGAAAVRATLDEGFHVEGRQIVVLGMVDGHEPDEVLRGLAVEQCDLLVVTTPDSPRGVDPVALAAQAERLGARAVAVERDVRDAVTSTIALADEADLVLVTGSLHTAGAARDVLGLAPGVVA